VASLAGYLVFGISVIAILGLCRTRESFTRLFAGLAVGWGIACFVQPEPLFSEAPWKFGFAVPVTLLLILLAVAVRSRLASVLLVAAAAVANILGDYRSLALLCAIAALPLVLGSGNALSQSSARRAYAAFVGGAVAVGLGIAAAYSALASSGVLGFEAAVRLATQGGGSPLLMLLGGRNEIFFSFPAALINPIIGLGPHPPVPAGILEGGIVTLSGLGLHSAFVPQADLTVLPMHSFIMSGWIEGGVLALLFWVFVLFTVVRGQVAALRTPRESVLPLFVGLLLTWNLFFSPFGGSNRFLSAAALAFLVHLIYLRRSEDSLAVTDEKALRL
jgi:hypothetical protein